MENHIKKLHEATENIEIFIANAYDWVDGENIPSLGIRDKENKGCVIDGIFWLIAGTAYHTNPVQEIKRLYFFKVLNVENIYIELRAQALVYGHSVHIDLGKRKIVSMEMHDDRIFAKLGMMQ